MANVNSGVLGIFSANVEYILHDGVRGEIPEELFGGKWKVRKITIVPSVEQGRQDFRVMIGNDERIFSGVSTGMMIAGSTVNCLSTMNKLGMPGTIASAIGRDFHGSSISAVMERDGIRFLRFDRQGGTPITVGIVKNGKERNDTTLFCEKPFYSLDPYKVVENLVREASPRIVVSTSANSEEEILLAKLFFDAFPEATKAFIPHHDLLVRQAANPSDNLKKILSLVDIFQVNEREANLLCKGSGVATAFSRQDLEQLVAKFMERKPRVIIVTLGKRGAATVAFTGGKASFYHHKAFRADVVDTTGSGDAFLGAILFALDQGVKHEKAVGFASWVAARNTEGWGGSYAKVDSNTLKRYLQDPAF